MDRRREYADCVAPGEFGATDVEYRYAGQSAQGLFVAFSLDGLAVSLWTCDQWNVDHISLEKSWIDGENLLNRILDVPHAARIDHLDGHLEWLRRHEPPPPANGSDVWKERTSLFPSLDFCESVEHQIVSLGGNDPRFKAALRGLCDLQNYCESWNTANFDIHQLANASGESESTLNMYSAERTFQCPDGQSRVFEWHLKRGDTRIRFVDFPSMKRILVGYVGDHSRISSQ